MYLKSTINPRAIKPFKIINLNPLRLYILSILVVIRIKLSVSKRLVLYCAFVFPQQMLTFPGFIMWLGSMAFFTRFIRDTVPSPSSSFRYSFLPTPTPCSPVPTYYKFMLTRRRKKSLLTSSVQCQCSMYKAVDTITNFSEFFFIIKKNQSMEVSLYVDNKKFSWKGKGLMR